MDPVSVDHALVQAVRAGLGEIADPTKAPQMQAYMKSALPFRGVTAVPGRALYRRLIDAHPLGSARSWQDTVRELFDHAGFREERYAALAIVRHRRYAQYRRADALPLLAHVTCTGAWWDLVDETAHAVGDVLRADRAAAEPTIRAWSTDESLWLRRAAIICQLGHRGDTDIALLSDAIVVNLDDPDFFVRKAIGWALRDYSKTDAVFVRDFVAAQTRLSGLSRREALKWLDRPASQGSSR